MNGSAAQPQGPSRLESEAERGRASRRERGGAGWLRALAAQRFRGYDVRVGHEPAGQGQPLTKDEPGPAEDACLRSFPLAPLLTCSHVPCISAVNAKHKTLVLLSRRKVPGPRSCRSSSRRVPMRRRLRGCESAAPRKPCQSDCQTGQPSHVFPFTTTFLLHCRRYRQHLPYRQVICPFSQAPNTRLFRSTKRMETSEASSSC